MWLRSSASNCEIRSKVEVITSKQFHRHSCAVSSTISCPIRHAVWTALAELPEDFHRHNFTLHQSCNRISATEYFNSFHTVVILLRIAFLPAAFQLILLCTGKSPSIGRKTGKARYISNLKMWYWQALTVSTETIFVPSSNAKLFLSETMKVSGLLSSWIHYLDNFGNHQL